MCRFDAALVALGLLVFPLAAEAGDAAPGHKAMQPAIVDLVLNTMRGDPLTVFLDGDDVLVREDDLKAAGLILPERAGSARPGYVSLAHLRPELSFVFDERELELSILAPAAWFRGAIVNLSPQRPAEMVVRRDTSVFLNYSGQLFDGIHASSYDEAGVSFDGKLIYGSVNASNDNGIVRMQNYIAFDDPKNLRRLLIGDAFVSGGPLGGAHYVGGVTLARNFDLDPYFVRSPALGFVGAVSTPATVDVYVDGRLVSRTQVAPGPLQLQNLQVPTGAGDVRYVVHDAFGSVQTFATPYYLAEGLLAKGLSEYTYSLGFAREGLGLESFHYGAPGFLGRHRVGLSNSVTAGLRAEVGLDRVSTGPTMTLGAPLGQIDLGAAGSFAKDGSGAAAYASWSYRGRTVGASVLAEAVSPRYSTLSLDPIADRAIATTAASASVAWGPRISNTVQQTFSLDRDTGYTARSALTTAVQITRDFNLTVTVGRSFNQTTGPAFELFALATYAFAGSMTASVGAQVEGPQREALLEFNRALPAGNGVGGHANVALGDTNELDAAVAAQSPYGRYEVSYLQIEGAPHLNVSVAGGLVWLHHAGVFAARPILSGFGVVDVPGAKDVGVTLNNQLVARTNASGKAVVPDLIPYYGNRIGIADTDLPLDYRIDSVESIVGPTNRGGALITFPAKRTKYVRGRLVVRRLVAGAPVDAIPKYGELRVARPSGTLTSPIGGGGEIELEGVEPGVYPSEVIYADGICRLDLSVVGGGKTLVDIGLVVCVQQGAR